MIHTGTHKERLSPLILCPKAVKTHWFQCLTYVLEIYGYRILPNPFQFICHKIKEDEGVVKE